MTVIWDSLVGCQEKEEMICGFETEKKKFFVVNKADFKKQLQGLLSKGVISRLSIEGSGTSLRFL